MDIFQEKEIQWNKHTSISQSAKHECCVTQPLVSLQCSYVDISTIRTEIINKANLILKEFILQL
jgi:hypothetical protein